MSTASLMKHYQGNLVNVRYHHNETEHYTGEGVSRYAIQSTVLEIELEGHLPFSLTSMEAHHLMLARGDSLEIAGVPFRDEHIVVYGIRNLTDGSTYLVLPSDAAQGAGLRWFGALLLLIGLIVSVYAWFRGERDPYTYLGPVFVCGALVGGIHLLRRLTRGSVLLNMPFSLHHQEGGRSERDAAARVLGIDNGAEVVPI